MLFIPSVNKKQKIMKNNSKKATKRKHRKSVDLKGDTNDKTTASSQLHWWKSEKKEQISKQANESKKKKKKN